MGQPIDIEGPLGGLSQNMSPRHIPPTAFVKAENVVNVAGVLRPRPGRTLAFAGEFSTGGGCFFDPASPGAAFELALDETTTPHTLYYIFQAAVGGSPSIRSVLVDGTGDTEILSAAALGNATEVRGLRFSSDGSTSVPPSTTVTATKIYVIQLTSVVLPFDVGDEFTVSVTTSSGTQTTSALNPTTSAVGMRSAIVALSNVTNVTVTRSEVSGSGVVRWTVTFVDPLVTEFTVFPRLTVADSNPDITVTVNGVQKRYTVVLTNLNPPDDGFTLSVRAMDNSLYTTARLTTFATPAQVKAALEALPNAGTVTVSRFSSANNVTYTITFNASELNEQFPRMAVTLLDVVGVVQANPGYLLAIQGGTYDRYLALVHTDTLTLELLRQTDAGFTVYGGYVIGWPWVIAATGKSSLSTSHLLAFRTDGTDLFSMQDSTSGPADFRQMAWNADDRMLYVTNSDIESPNGATIHQYRLAEFGPNLRPAVVDYTRFDALYPIADIYYNGNLRRLYFTTDGDALGTQNIYFCPVLEDGVLGDSFQIATTTDAMDHPRGVVVDALGTVYWSTVRE